MTHRFNENDSPGSRINAIIQYYRMNKNSFSIKIGMKDNSLITKIVNDPTRLFSVDILQRIANSFPDINMRWLVLGEGEMLLKTGFADPKYNNIKYFKNTPDPVDYLRIAGYEDCDTAFDVYGDMMAPKFRNGDIIICKEKQLSDLTRFGEAYLIVSHEAPMYRYIKNEIDSETIKLGAENPRYEDTVMRKSEIQRLYIIKGVIRREAF
jgi:hypothetical protein